MRRASLVVALGLGLLALGMQPAVALTVSPTTGVGMVGGNVFALNTFGTLFLVGGSLYAIARRRRVWTNAWIGGGALVVALATGLSRTGTYSLVYAGELVGIALMFYGFTWAGKPSPARGRGTAPAAKPATAHQ